MQKKGLIYPTQFSSQVNTSIKSDTSYQCAIKAFILTIMSYKSGLGLCLVMFNAYKLICNGHASIQSLNESTQPSYLYISFQLVIFLLIIYLIVSQCVLPKTL